MYLPSYGTAYGPFPWVEGGSKGVRAWRMCVLAEGLLPCEGAVGGCDQTVKHQGR